MARIDAGQDGLLGEAEQTDLRGLIFADAETRALRDAMLATRSTLLQAIPALWSDPAPAGLLARLLASLAPAKPRRTQPRRPLAAFGLVGLVLLTAMLIVVAPGWFRPAPQTAQQNVSAEEILYAALHRFDQPQISSGVLHEAYRVQLAGQSAISIERWYDYASPNRLALDMRDAANQRLRFAVRADGQGQIQYELPRRRGWRQSQRIDYELTADKAQGVLPILRSILMPISFQQDQMVDQPEINTLFLAQARDAQATLLGTTTVGQRSAYLLRYTTDQLPTETGDGETRQVLLTIDSQLSALLDVTVLPISEGEAVAYRPWYVETIELLGSVPDSQFSLSDSNALEVTTPRSISLPVLPQERYTTLDAALRESTQLLLAPSQLPEPMRGLVIQQQVGYGSGNFALLYESEYRSLVVTPGWQNTPNWSDMLEVNGFVYRIAEGGDEPGSLSANVYMRNDPQESVNIVLYDALSTPAERQQRLEAIIAALEPITAGNLDQFQRQLSGDSTLAE